MENELEPQIKLNIWINTFLIPLYYALTTFLVLYMFNDWQTPHKNIILIVGALQAIHTAIVYFSLHRINKNDKENRMGVYGILPDQRISYTIGEHLVLNLQSVANCAVIIFVSFFILFLIR